MSLSAKQSKVLELVTKKAEKQKTKAYSAEELLKMQPTTVDFSSAHSDKEKLEVLLKTILGCIPVAEALFKASPKRANGLLLTNLMSQAQALLEQLEDKTDYQQVSENLFFEIIQPALEGYVLDLGKQIKLELIEAKADLPVKGYKRVKKHLDKVFVSFGQHMTDSIKPLREDIFKFLSS